MENTSWLRQVPDKPLFPELLWSRPENKSARGKLLIIGGNLHSFTAPAAAYTAALGAGVGAARVLLPDALRKTLGQHFSEAQFTASTPSGSFSRQALATFIEEASWADGVLLAGDFGKNPETAILLEAFTEKYPGLLTLTGDSLDYFTNSAGAILKRDNTAITASFGQLQKLGKSYGLTQPLKNSMDLSQLVRLLQTWSKEIRTSVVTMHAGHVLVVTKGRASTTPVKEGVLGVIATASSVWWLQHPKKPFEALTSAVC